MKTIYILLTKSDTIVSRLIRVATSDKYTHVSISFEDSLCPFYSFARKYIHSPLPAGLRKEELDDGFFKLYDYIPCALYSFQTQDEAYLKAKKHVEAMMRHSDIYRFNIYGLFLCKVNIAIKRRRHYFCSQFVGEILSNSGALSLPKNTALMRPVDYAHMPELDLMYHGTIGELVRKMQDNQARRSFEEDQQSGKSFDKCDKKELAGTAR